MREQEKWESNGGKSNLRLVTKGRRRKWISRNGKPSLGDCLRKTLHLIYSLSLSVVVDIVNYNIVYSPNLSYLPYFFLLLLSRLSSLLSLVVVTSLSSCPPLSLRLSLLVDNLVLSTFFILIAFLYQPLSVLSIGPRHDLFLLSSSDCSQ